MSTSFESGEKAGKLKTTSSLSEGSMMLDTLNVPASAKGASVQKTIRTLMTECFKLPKKGWP